jgi:hypothetical protein
MVVLRQAKSLLRVLRMLRSRDSNANGSDVVSMRQTSTRELQLDSTVDGCHHFRVNFESPLERLEELQASLRLHDLLVALATLTQRSDVVSLAICNDCLCLETVETAALIQLTASLQLLDNPSFGDNFQGQVVEEAQCRFEGDCKDLASLMASTAILDAPLVLTANPERVRIEARTEALHWSGENDFRHAKANKFGHVHVTESVRVELPQLVTNCLRAILLGCKSFRLEIHRQRMVLTGFVEFDGDTSATVSFWVT